MFQIGPRWGETAQSLLKKSLEAEDRHLRERLLALSLVAGGETRTDGRHRNAITEWIRRFNARGVSGLVSGWKGNPGRILTERELEVVSLTVSRHPRESGLKTGRWTSLLVAAFVEKRFGKKIGEETARKYLHLPGYRHKVPVRKLIKADPKKQKEFAQELAALERERSANSVTAYVDQGQIWQDALPRKGWFRKGVPAEVDSASPGKKKALFYAAVIRPKGKVVTMQVGRFDQKTTARFLKKLRRSLSGLRIDMVWDNAPWHKGQSVRDALKASRINERRLPAYSPQMNACEYFIRWAKETLSYNYCWRDTESLKLALRGFAVSVAAKADEVLRRCKP